MVRGYAAGRGPATAGPRPPQQGLGPRRRGEEDRAVGVRPPEPGEVGVEVRLGDRPGAAEEEHGHPVAEVELAGEPVEGGADVPAGQQARSGDGDRLLLPGLQVGLRRVGDDQHVRPQEQVREPVYPVHLAADQHPVPADERLPQGAVGGGEHGAADRQRAGDHGHRPVRLLRRLAGAAEEPAELGEVVAGHRRVGERGHGPAERLPDGLCGVDRRGHHSEAERRRRGQPGPPHPPRQARQGQRGEQDVRRQQQVVVVRSHPLHADEQDQHHWIHGRDQDRRPAGGSGAEADEQPGGRGGPSPEAAVVDRLPRPVGGRVVHLVGGVGVGVVGGRRPVGPVGRERHQQHPGPHPGQGQRRRPPGRPPPPAAGPRP